MMQQTTNVNTRMMPRRIHRSISVDKLVSTFKHSTKGNRKVLTSPISGYNAKVLFPELLSQRDIADIEQYNEIYYLKKVRGPEIIQEENDFEYFNFQQNGHIAFRYEELEFLGRGSFGTVIKCKDHKTNKYVAIKVVLNDDAEVREQMDLEASYLMDLSHHENGPQNHHVINIIDRFVFREFYCIVTDLNCIDLYSYLASRGFVPLPIEEIRNIGCQLANALEFIHSAGIVHSDIKPENIMFTDKTLSSISVIDFGCACHDKEPLYKVVQSLYYRAPEVIFGFKYGREIDVWSFACVLFELATGKPLFCAQDEEELISEITQIVGKPPLEMIVRSKKMREIYEQVAVNRTKYEAEKKKQISEMMKGIDSDLIDLICDCLQWFPSKRPTMKQILEHPFFKK